MPSLLSASEICEAALEKIGSFSINDTAADGEELKRSAKWLDLVVGEMTETERCTWLIEDTVTIPLVGGQATYNLADAMGANYPPDGVMFITSTWITDDTNDDDVELIRRADYEGLEVKGATGKPKLIYIDRLADKNDQSFTVYPVPVDATHSLKIVFQKYAPNLRNDVGKKAHGFRRGWQMWLVLATAAAIGGGPVRRLPKAEVDSIKRDAEISFNKLQASQNRENVAPRRVRAWGA